MSAKHDADDGAGRDLWRTQERGSRAESAPCTSALATLAPANDRRWHVHVRRRKHERAEKRKKREAKRLAKAQGKKLQDVLKDEA